ncbi:MAG: metallophosphoesterase, partial [Candidatus Methanoperedens sp.]
MKLLALSDLHGDYSHVDSILEKAGDFDVVLLAGDITNFGPDNHALELLKMFKQPILAVPGNCDYP